MQHYCTNMTPRVTPNTIHISRILNFHFNIFTLIFNYQVPGDVKLITFLSNEWAEAELHFEIIFMINIEGQQNNTYMYVM